MNSISNDNHFLYITKEGDKRVGYFAHLFIIIDMKTLREYINEARERKTAVGHFNISDIVAFRAIVDAAQSVGVPVIIGVSEGERYFIGIKQVKVLVNSLQAEGRPVFLNADHTYSLDRVKEVVDADYDSVIIDAADKSFDQNVAITKSVVDYRDTANTKVLVEAELGFIGKSSKLLDEIPEGAQFDEGMMTNVEEAKEFVSATGIDLFAPAVGNIHGMVKSGHNPKLSIERIKQLRENLETPLVLHGGSGVTDEEFKLAIAAGISVIHINTEIRVAYRTALQKFLTENPDEIAPYKFLHPAQEEMQKVVEKRLRLFSNQ